MRRTGLALVCGWVVLCCASRAASPAAPVTALWKEQHVNFVYPGRTVRYSCDGLRDKVRAMLLDLGARRDLTVRVIGCADEVGRSPGAVQPSLAIVFSAPIVTDGAVKAPHPGGLTGSPAHFEPFKITSDAFRNMGIGDCELVREFARQILPKLTTRGVKQDIACVSRESRGSRFLVGGEVLKMTLPRKF